MSEYREHVDDLLAEYHRSREQLAAVQRELAAVAGSAVSPDGRITATAGPRGTLTALDLHEDVYQRYSPAELAAQIVRTADSAATRALAGAGEVLAPALPPGTDPRALLLGTADLTEAELAPVAPAASADRRPGPDEEESFDQQSWVDGSPRPGAR